jgi:hypothetical protein
MQNQSLSDMALEVPAALMLWLHPRACTERIPCSSTVKTYEAAVPLQPERHVLCCSSGCDVQLLNRTGGTHAPRSACLHSVQVLCIIVVVAAVIVVCSVLCACAWGCVRQGHACLHGMCMPPQHVKLAGRFPGRPRGTAEPWLSSSQVWPLSHRARSLKNIILLWILERHACDCSEECACMQWVAHACTTAAQAVWSFNRTG